MLFSQYYGIWLSSASVNNELSGISCVLNKTYTEILYLFPSVAKSVHIPLLLTHYTDGGGSSTINFPESRMFILGSFCDVFVFYLWHG